MNKYDIDKLLEENEIAYPDESEDEGSIQKRWQMKKTAFYFIPKHQ